MNLYVMTYDIPGLYVIKDVVPEKDIYDILAEHNFKESQVEWMACEDDLDLIELINE